jgi:hypothetical protein
MDRYVFFAPHRIPPGLHVIGVPTASGLVWVEITEAEYRTAVADVEAARQLAAYASEVLAERLVGAGEPVRESWE